MMIWTQQRLIDRRRWLALSAAVMVPAGSRAAPADRGLAVTSVLELFTSQSCSSCPPADALFCSLVREPGTLALSLPVTIWDHLGWKDTLAQPAFSRRQKDYARQRGDRAIYTPQVVVNGVLHAGGSDLGAITEARRDSRRPGVMALGVDLIGTGDRWRVTIAPGGREGTVLLVPFERSRTVAIGRGENSGRTNRYANVVRSLVPIGRYRGEALALTLSADAVADAGQSFAILVQDGDLNAPGAILGAAEAPRLT